MPLPYYNIRARGQPIIHLLIPPIARMLLLNPLLFSFRRRIEQWDLFIIVLLRPDPARREVVFHSCSQREVVIPGGKSETNIVNSNLKFFRIIQILVVTDMIPPHCNM